jgi:hypothetical protein
MRHASDMITSSLYRRSLKLALDWAVHRYIWRGQALYIRGLFEANKHVTEPRQQRVSAFPGQYMARRTWRGNANCRRKHGKHRNKC